MAVYTEVSAEEIAGFLADYDVGTLRSAKGIAEGVENSNYLIETDRNRFILTLYEKRVDADDLPFFIAMLDHLAAKGQPVPRILRGRDGEQIRSLAARPACLIQFLDGVSPGKPTAAQARAAGHALASLHVALADFEPVRPNPLSLAGWQNLSKRMTGDLDAIGRGLADDITGELVFLERSWPTELPKGAIHADLFPDNVLMLGDTVSGIIDFYFACTDIHAYDLAVMHTAWCFAADGSNYDAALGDALIAGYEEARPLSQQEKACLPILARGASLRFLLTRAWDWLNTAPDALVTRKDPLAYHRRLEHYRAADPSDFGA